MNKGYLEPVTDDHFRATCSGRCPGCHRVVGVNAISRENAEFRLGAIAWTKGPYGWTCPTCTVQRGSRKPREMK